MRMSLLLGLFVCALLACGDASRPASAAKSEPAPAGPRAPEKPLAVPAAAAATPTLPKLVQPIPPSNPESLAVRAHGKGQKRIVRYAFAPGQTQRLSVEVSTQTEGASGLGGAKGAAPRTVSGILEVRVLGVAANGDTTLEARTVATEKGATPAHAGLAADRRGSLDDLRIEWTISPRGLLLSGSTELPGDAPDEMHGIVDRLRAVLQELTPPLPEAPLGVGARVAFSRELTVGGALKVMSTTSYLLREDSDQKRRFALTLAQQADKQEALGIGFERWTGNGKGECEAARSSPLAFQCDLSWTQHVAMKLPESMKNLPNQVGVVTHSRVRTTPLP
jgi:hypothetical protein